jgi:site-specific DNA recombinase
VLNSAAVIFCRVSTAKQQQRNEANLPAQEKRCQDWCKANKLPVLRVFVAEGESAWETTRPVFEECLAFVQENKDRVTHFVVQDVSRFSRNMETQVIAMARLKKLGVKFVSVDEPSIDSSPVGMMLAAVLGSVSQFYSHSLSSRVKSRFQHHREQGRWLHKAPLGFKNVQQNGLKTIVPDEVAPLLKQTFEMIASGQHSSEQVRKLITAAGLRNKKGQKLTKQTFSFTVKNPMYCGLLVHSGQTYKASFPALISEDLWQQAQDCLRGKNKAMPKKPSNEDFPLRGFVRCGFCNMKLTAAKPKGRSKTYPKYWCCNAGCKNRFSISVDKIETDWLNYLEQMQPCFEALVNVLPVLAKAKAGKRIEEREQRQRTLSTQLADKQALNVKLITAKLNGELNQADFETMKAVLAKDIQEIETAQRVLNAEAETLLHLTEDTSRKAIPARALWIAAPLSEKQTVQSVLFPEGICYRKDLGFFAPVTNELEAVVFQCLLELADHGEAYEMEEVLDGGPGWT